MYIKYRTRSNKNNINQYYFYNCRSYRQDGKVKTKQEYLLKISESDITLNKYFDMTDIHQLRDRNILLWLMLITKIQFVIRPILEKEYGRNQDEEFLFGTV